MLPVRICRDDVDIDNRLEDFEVTREALVAIAQAVVAARADAIADDPASAEGLLAYIYGT